MPQLMPFYFVSQLSYVFLALTFLTYVYSIYFMPNFTQLNVTRMYFTKI